jgi:hypothetical protein
MAAGAIAGAIMHSFLNLHLEMQWWALKRDLRRFYSQDRKDRGLELAGRPRRAPVEMRRDGEQLTDEEIRTIIARNNPAPQVRGE